MSSDPANAPSRAARQTLLAGVSISALAAGLAAPAQAAPPRPLSAAWFAARVDASTGGAAAASNAGTLAHVTTATRNLATIATRLQQLQAAQTAAAQTAAANIAAANTGATAVPNGLEFGGLQPAAGAAAGSPLWTGADLPTQASAANGRTAVAVKQTTAQAVLTWQTFNVGAKTDLSFDQSAGGSAQSNWVVLNRVEDPAAAPSQILGSIKAPGKVFVINANGIMFGAGSQVNLGALIASTADIPDSQFTTAGIYGAPSGASFLPSFQGASPDSAILVEPGAAITTAAPGSISAGGGYVMLLGGMVENDGAITTQKGQTVLAAGQDFILRSGYSSTANQTATVQGSQVATTAFDTTPTAPADAPLNPNAGTVLNTGIIQAPLGDITLAGHTVTQAGAALSTTSVATRGSIHLLDALDDTTGSITLAPGSVTAVNPDNAPTTALDSQRASLITQSAANNILRANPASAANPQLDDVAQLPDRLDLSRVEITTGGTVAFAANSLTMTQGGQLAVTAGQRVWAGDGAQLDVSGSTGAILPASSNTVTVNIQGNELRDSPVNRDTGLITSQNVAVDIRGLVQIPASSADPNIRDYTAGGLLEVSGYLGNTGHTIDEWTAVGGAITLASDAVITQPTATFNLAGGSVQVASGLVPQSYVIGPDGHLYNVNDAPANLPYLGVYGAFTVDAPRWGVTTSFMSPVAAAAQRVENGYDYGRDAGRLTVTAQTAALEGQIQAGVTNGATQTAPRAAGITDGYLFSQSAIAQPGSLAIGGYTQAGTLLTPMVTVTNAAAPVAGSIAVDGPLPDGLANSITLSASQLNSEALGGLAVVTGGHIVIDAPLTLANGGSLALTAANIAVNAALTAHGGAITLSDVATDPTGAIVPLLPGEGGVSIAPGAVIDLSGLYTNAIADPSQLAGLGLLNGGAFAAESAGALEIGAGSVIDTSAGAALLPGGKQVGGAGGNVTLAGDDPLYYAGDATVTFGATLRGAGVNGGGTFSLTAPKILIAEPGTPTALHTSLITPSLFESGFSDYVVNGFNGLDVAPATVITVAEPVYAFFGTPVGSPVNGQTGEAPSAVLQLLLPPTYATNGATGRLTQRKGASLAFISNDRPGTLDIGGGAISLGAGAEIAVDPGQSVRIEAYGQITDDAAITARGGSVAIINTRSQQLLAAPIPPASGEAAAPDPNTSLSIWIGGDASIDASGLATTAPDAFGRPYGVVTAGGAITIGSDGGLAIANNQISTDAQILIRPGATLNASGAQATIDLAAGAAPQLNRTQSGAASVPVAVASDGGSITISSYTAISPDGVLQAAPGGPGAAGGSLAMTLEDPVYAVGITIPADLDTPRTLTLSDTTTSRLGDTPLLPGADIPLFNYGHATLSQQQIDAGGFADVSLFVRDVFGFTGAVSLYAASSLTLRQGIITDTSAQGAVTLRAPVVTLTGETGIAGESPVTPSINGPAWHPYNGSTEASLIIEAGLIDLGDALRFGVSTTGAARDTIMGAAAGAASLPGFATVTLSSSGDIRFATGSLTTPGNLNLVAADIYPVTGAVASVFAGYDQYAAAAATGDTGNLFTPTGAITITGTGTGTGTGASAAVPYSVGGSLALYAGSIVQGGVIRAPEGNLTLGGIGIGPGGLVAGEIPSNSFTYSVALAPGSITSVSLDGLTVPYGGTVDGVTYLYNGAPVAGFTPSVTLAGQVQSVAAGATLDLSGGGELAGAGFITGRGGSTDVLTTPLLSFGGAGPVSPSLADAPVYAILPGYASAYAPTSPIEEAGTYGSVPALGAQITIGNGVPGLAAGTYTLLPSYFALLPGAARVQVNTGRFDQTPGVTALGAGSFELNATTSSASSGARGAIAVDTIVTPAAGVARLSQYDTQSYSSFQIAQAAHFGAPRPALPEDGKTLNLLFPATSASNAGAAPAVTALSVDANATIDFAPTLEPDEHGALIPVPGSYAGQASVGGQAGGLLDLEITGDRGVPAPGFTAITASSLNALGAPRLTIGGTLTPSPNASNQLAFIGTANQVVVGNGASLQAPELFLVSGAAGTDSTAGAITVETGATLSTVGQGAPPYDSTAGYFYNPNGFTVVALSNGLLTFLPVVAPDVAAGDLETFGPITIADGATLDTQGTLNFLTDQNLSLSAKALYTARYLSISVDTINIASNAAFAASTADKLPLPSGVFLTQNLLDTLLKIDPVTQDPTLQSLTLTASKSINFATYDAPPNMKDESPTDTVSLTVPAAKNGATPSLVLNTPAIYGAGSARDTATIQTAGALYWNGIETQQTLGFGTTPGSALPGGAVTNGPGNGLGTLNIAAQTAILGYGPNTAPDTQTSLDRLIEGFSQVNLTGSTSVSGTQRGTLSIYQSPGTTYGVPGTGGGLTITTPLLTGGAASTLGITAGGALTIAAPLVAPAPMADPVPAPSTATNGALGAEIDLAGASIDDTTTTLLNSGRLTFNATADVTLGPSARIDLSGEAVTLLDQTRYSGGGSLVLQSAAGGISADPAASIDISAPGGATAGSLQATAIAGAVDLQGPIDGGAASPASSGSVSLRAAMLPDAGVVSGFDSLNERLNTGGIFGTRSFELGTGDLDVDQTVRAHAVSITTDTGSITVDKGGLIDASGATPGSISLAAGTGLTLSDGAVLTAAGTVLQTDSTGAPIEAENRASVSLTATAGTLTLGNATINVSSPNPTPLGQVTLTAPRDLAPDKTELGTVTIAAAGSIDIIGAQSITLYASRTYTPTDVHGSVVQHANQAASGAVNLDQIDLDNTRFIDLATATATTPLAKATAGLRAYGAAYHLRPADIIASSAASGGNLTVASDLDLSSLRYPRDADSAADEPGRLTLRAANNLFVNGSITDGFATPADAVTPTPDNSGWVLFANDPIGQAVTLPQTPLAVPVTLASGTTFPTNNPVALNYDIRIGRATIGANVVIPGAVETNAAYIIPAGGVTLTAAITSIDTVTGIQSPLFPAGKILPAGTMIPAMSVLQPGTVLPFQVQVVDGTTWPAGAKLSLFTDLSVRLNLTADPMKVKPPPTITLAGGAYIPVGASLVFSNKKTTSVALRAPNDGYGTQGLIYPIASLLPPGSQSWSLDLIGGANLASADLLAVQPTAGLTGAPPNTLDPAGSVVLNDNHYTSPPTSKSGTTANTTDSFSVVRTGTGALNVVAGGNVDEQSLFGVYTAGTDTSLGAAEDAAFQAGRSTLADGTVLGKSYNKTYNLVIAGQQQSYPDHGGDVLVSAQNRVLGDVIGNDTNGFSPVVGTDNVGDWLWRQGGSAFDQPTAWWINFGSYVIPQQVTPQNIAFLNTVPILTGFTGIGALGGGNVTVNAGGDAGAVNAVQTSQLPMSQGLVVAVGSTGRVTSVSGSPGGITGGTTEVTGGGALTVHVGGTLNPAAQSSAANYSGLGGTLVDLRGPIEVSAGQIGRIDLSYTGQNASDPRPQNPFTAVNADANNGLAVVPGDGSVTIDTLRDLVLSGAGDPGRVPEQAYTAIDPALVPATKFSLLGGYTGFSLWTDATSINLFSAGGNLTPTTGVTEPLDTRPANDSATDFRFVYPSTLKAVAASGSLYYGQRVTGATLNIGYSLELAPSPTGQLELLAADSIFAHGYDIDMSGAGAGLNDIPNPYNPAYTDGPSGSQGVVGNYLLDLAHTELPISLFAFEADMATNLHATDTVPALIYAAAGDLVNFQFGEAISFPLSDNLPQSTWYIAAKPARIMAGRDIVSGGALPAVANSAPYAAGLFQTFPNQRDSAALLSITTGNLLLNNTPNSISVYSAGRDILGSYIYVAGPGLLELDAGRNINETGSNGLNFGVVKSIGPIVDVSAADRTSGAGIAITAGAGALGPDYSAFSDLYFDPANQADLGIPLADPSNTGKVQQTYQAQLLAWLQGTQAYTGDPADALAYFQTLPALTQDVFDRSVFYQELTAAGRQQSDPQSLFFGSYKRGSDAIATLFPERKDSAGRTIPYDGSVTLDSGTLKLGPSGPIVQFDAGISTLAGGSVQLLTPGGGDVLGVAGGPSPGASSGIVTFGSGDIDIYALDSVLLGQSRIFTTFGGNILIWSAQGDVNAGRGAKTTTVVQPPLIAYDDYGGLTLSPQAPTSGAGIATLTPIPGTVPGDVDLIAPLGTVDAGEAGIRVSGNLNIAALAVVGAANIQTQGKTTGNTATVSVNVAAAATASSVAGSSQSAANNAAAARAQQQPTGQPSIITVEILSAGSSINDDQRKRHRPAA